MSDQVGTPNGDPPGVWPPPPSSQVPPSGYPPPYYPRFQPLTGLSTACLALLWVTAAVDTASSLVLLTSLTALGGTLAIIAFLVYLATGIVFLVWTHRAYENIPAISAQKPRFSPGWTVAYFFIPFLSLYKPYQAFQEMWRVSDPDPDVGSSNKGGGLIGAWWAAYLLMGVFSWIDSAAAQSAGKADPALSALDITTTIAAAALACQVVSRISSRMEARNAATQRSMAGSI